MTTRSSEARDACSACRVPQDRHIRWNARGSRNRPQKEKEVASRSAMRLGHSKWRIWVHRPGQNAGTAARGRWREARAAPIGPGPCEARPASGRSGTAQCRKSAPGMNLPHAPANTSASKFQRPHGPWHRTGPVASHARTAPLPNGRGARRRGLGRGARPRQGPGGALNKRRGTAAPRPEPSPPTPTTIEEKTTATKLSTWPSQSAVRNARPTDSTTFSCCWSDSRTASATTTYASRASPSRARGCTGPPAPEVSGATCLLALAPALARGDRASGALRARAVHAHGHGAGGRARNRGGQTKHLHGGGTPGRARRRHDPVFVT